MTNSEKAACEDVISAYRSALTLLDEIANQPGYLPEELEARIIDAKTLAGISIADLLRFMEGSRK